MTAALIERLEKAEIGNPILDRDIFSLFDERNTIEGIENDRYAFENEPGWYCSVPDFTTSLDAALALAERVLPGWCWELTLMPDEATWQGAPEMWPEGLAAPDRGGVWASMKTPALALCIAILKAKAAQS